MTALVLFVCTAALAGKYNRTLDIGKVAPAWSKLPGVDGKLYSLADLKNKQVIVVVFTCNSCPYAVDYEDRIIEFAKKYCGKSAKVALVAINVNTNPEDQLPAMKERASKKKFPYPYLFDESQEIAVKFGAIWTPEFFVLNKERKVVYMGAMDDNTAANKVKKKHLEAAVQAALAGAIPKVAETVAVGCQIRRKRRRRGRKRSTSSPAAK